MNLLFKSSLKNIARSPFQAMAAISILAITFFVSTLIATTVFSSTQILKYFETRPQVIAFLKDDATQDQIDELMGRLKNDSRINSLKFVSKEQAMDIYKGATSDNPTLGELVSPSIFPASIEFSPSALDYAQDLISEMKNEVVVDDVRFTASVGSNNSATDVIGRLRTISYYVKVAGAIAIGVLSLTSFLVLMVVIGMRISTKRGEMESLSLIGATPGFIRTPLVLEAIHYCVIGAFVGWLGASVIVMYASPHIFSYFGQIPVLPTKPQDFFLLLGAVLGVELLVAIVIALLGSMVAVSRSLKLK